MTPTIGFRIALLSGSTRGDFPAGLRTFKESARHAGSTKYRRIANRHKRSVWAILFLTLTLSLRCYSSEVVLLRSGGSPSPEQHELELATQFYGLNLKIVTTRANQIVLTPGAIRPDTTVAVTIEADALAKVDRKALLRALRRGRKGSVPLLILGVTPETDETLLSEWSGITAIGARSLDSPSGLHYVVGSESAVTQQLAGFEFPFPGDKTFYFHLAENSKAQVIMAVRKDHQVVPVFIEEDVQGQKVFMLCKTHPSGDNAVDWISDNTEDAFEKIAAVMVFTKYSAGERGWHALHHYANLTIDDPWLREPYGNLSYEGLLNEMEKHNFHTTIAFIPWNYDRSEAYVVSLFRRHPDRFSICIHGDNHAHKEFTDYESKPLDVQVTALRQSVARMEKFQAQTGIPYDRVMVFPHSIAPEQTLEALKANDYLATINSQNVPMGSLRLTGLLFAMRPTTLSFASFPSILRYPVASPTPSYRVAIEDFLDNPLFYYAHQDLFAKGIDAFDGLADEVNKLEPDTKWRNVGDIVKHRYLLRLREDSNYDVLALSSSLLLDNTFGRDLVFYVKRLESGSTPITSASVDGRPLPFQLHDGYLDFHLPVPAGETRSIVIQYQSAEDIASISTSKSSPYVYVLRTISDFRDITLSRVQVGRAFTALYYAHRVTAELLILGGCGLIVFCITVGGWGLVVIMRRKNVVKQPSDTLPIDKLAGARPSGPLV
jgi:hypothetical protein